MRLGVSEIYRITIKDLDTDEIIYDDHPAAAMIAVSQHSGTRSFCINDSDEIDYLALSFASAEHTKRELFKIIPGLKRAYKDYLRRVKNREIRKEFRTNQEEE